jgi:Domain of unknown function (DUF4345)
MLTSVTTHRPMDEPDWRAVRQGPGRRTTRALLGCLATCDVGIGAYAAVAPHAFYRNVVGVDLLGPYNQHLVGDAGGLYLGFALLFAWAALRPGRELVRAACVGFLLTEVIHLAYHLAHLERFSFDQAVLQTMAVAPLLALPVAVLGQTRRTT